MAHPKQTLTQNIIDKSPFQHMKIDDNSILSSVEARSPCSKCFKSRKYFCYSCYIPVDELSGKLPVVQLPFKIDIIKHKHEIDGKSTAVHAAILAPYDVSIYTYPDIPSYDDIESTVLIFPSANAVTIEKIFNDHVEYEVDTTKCHNNGTLLKRLLKPDYQVNTINNIKYTGKNLPIKRAVFIDSTWNQSKGIYKDERIRRIKSVVLQNRISQFWRHQKNSPRWYLATIEAVHQFVVEVHVNAWKTSEAYKGLDYFFSDTNKITYVKENQDGQCEKSYNGQYDNLLFFFKYMYEKIHLYYDHLDLKAYKRPINVM